LYLTCIIHRVIEPAPDKIIIDSFSRKYKQPWAYSDGLAPVPIESEKELTKREKIIKREREETGS